MSIVKNIKNLFSARIALLCCLVGTAGLAQAGTKLYINDFSIKAGEEKTIALNLDCDVELRNLEGVIKMPAGLVVQDQGTNQWMSLNEDRASLGAYNPFDGPLIIYGFPFPINSGTGAVAYIKVKATEDLADGSTITLSDFKATDTDNAALEVVTSGATVYTVTPTVSFNPTLLSLMPGATGQVEVAMENSMELTAVQATVTASEGLELAGVVKGSRMTGGSISLMPGNVVLYMGGQSGYIAAGSGTVMTVSVKALEGFTGGTIKISDITVAMKNGTSFTPKDVEMSVELSDGSIVISKSGSDTYVAVDESKGTPKAGIISDGLVAKELTYKRTLAAGTLYSVCLPALPTAESLKYYELAGAEGTALSFNEVASPAVNTPYLVTADAETLVTLVAADVTLSQTVNGKTAGKYVMKGTLTGLTNGEAAAAGAYILQAGGEWKRVTSASTEAYIPPFRSFIVAAGTEARLSTVINETTAIERLRTVDLDGTEHWYDLNGRSIAAPAQRGIYVVNGKKIIK